MKIQITPGYLGLCFKCDGDMWKGDDNVEEVLVTEPISFRYFQHKECPK